MNKRKLPSVVSFLILTLITVVMWVTFDVYRLYNKPVEVVVPEAISASLNPNLDQDAINQIVTKIFLDDSQIPDQVANPSTPTSKTFATETTPAPVATESATP